MSKTFEDDFEDRQRAAMQECAAAYGQPFGEYATLLSNAFKSGWIARDTYGMAALRTDAACAGQIVLAALNKTVAGL